MFLAIDIGNSLTKFGIFDREKLIKKFTIPSLRTRSAGEIYELIKNEIPSPIEAVIVSTVVTELETAFRELAEKSLNARSIFLNHSFDFGLKINYDQPEKLGLDRIFAAVAAANIYDAPVIVCDFGTATTIDYVNAKNEFEGGIIAPGVATLADALHLKTSKLPRVTIEKPAQIVGKSTAHAIQSGIFYGYLGLVEGILKKMLIEIEASPKIVATGGFASMIAGDCKLIEIVNENLVLEGLGMIYRRIANQKN